MAEALRPILRAARDSRSSRGSVVRSASLSAPASAASRARVGLGAVLALALSGCGRADEDVPITDARPRSATAPALPLGVSAADRLGLAPEWRDSLPTGWQAVDSPRNAPGRVATLRVGAPAGDGAECTLTVLEGAGGGVVENINRWRRQLGLPAVEPDAAKALPTKPMLGLDARFV